MFKLSPCFFRKTPIRTDYNEKTDLINSSHPTRLTGTFFIPIHQGAIYQND